MRRRRETESRGHGSVRQRYTGQREKDWHMDEWKRKARLQGGECHMSKPEKMDEWLKKRGGIRGVFENESQRGFDVNWYD